MAHFKLTTLSLDCVVTEYKITGFPRLTFEVAELVGVSEGSGERLWGSLPTRRGTISKDDLSVHPNELLELMATGEVEVRVHTTEGVVLTGPVEPLD